jgi:hypothetical protein
VRKCHDVCPASTVHTIFAPSTCVLRFVTCTSTSTRTGLRRLTRELSYQIMEEVRVAAAPRAAHGVPFAQATDYQLPLHHLGQVAELHETAPVLVSAGARNGQSPKSWTMSCWGRKRIPRHGPWTKPHSPAGWWWPYNARVYRGGAWILL